MSQYKYGPTFKKFRKIKGFTMKETAEGIMSTQALRNFESGQSDTTLSNFLLLLDRIFVTWREFIASHNDNFLDQLDHFDKTVNQMLHNKEYYELKQLGKKLSERYDESQSTIHYHFSILIKSVVFMAGIGDEPTPSETNAIKTHLKEMPEWTDYENYLFGSFLYLFTVEEVKIFHKISLKKMTKELDTEETATNSPILLIVNIIGFFIRKEEFQEALSFIRSSEKLVNQPNASTNLFYKILFKFYKGLVLITFDDKQGIELCQSCIDAFGSIGNYKNVINNLYFQLRAIRKHTSLTITI